MIGGDGECIVEASTIFSLPPGPDKSQDRAVAAAFRPASNGATHEATSS